MGYDAVEDDGGYYRPGRRVIADAAGGASTVVRVTMTATATARRLRDTDEQQH
jgi:hypothetical protein